MTNKLEEKIRETLEELVRVVTKEWINIQKGKTPKTNEAVDQATQAILKLVKPIDEGILQADEVTLAFFRKYLKMPNGTLEELCQEIIRLKKIKPMSRYRLYEIIANNQQGMTGIQISKIAVAILEEWGKGE